MECDFCGKTIKRDMKFCVFCGEKITINSKVKRTQIRETAESEAFTIDTDNYFITRWTALLSLLGTGFKASLFAAVGSFIILFLLEVGASLFGYCITVRNQECIGGVGDLFLLPVVFSGLVLLQGFGNSGQTLIQTLKESNSAITFFGLSTETQAVIPYLQERGLHTLFLKRYHLFFLIGSVLMFVSDSIESFILYAISLILLTDLRFYRVLSQTSDYLNKHVGGQTTEKPLGVKEHITSIFKLLCIAILTIIFFVMAVVILDIFIS